MKCNPSAHIFYGFFIPKEQGVSGNELDVTSFTWSAYLDGSEHKGEEEQVEESVTDIISWDRYPSGGPNVTVVDGRDGSYVYITASRQSIAKPDKRIMLGPQLVADPTWGEMLGRFCAEANIPHYSPQWCLVWNSILAPN